MYIGIGGIGDGDNQCVTHKIPLSYKSVLNTKKKVYQQQVVKVLTEVPRMIRSRL